MKTIDALIELENRADRAAAALAFTTGCGRCETRRAIGNALLELAAAAKGNPSVSRLRAKRPLLWGELLCIEEAVCDLELSVYETQHHRREPSVN